VRRPDAVIFDKIGKTILVLEFKRTSDQRSDYRERREAKQHKVLVKSLTTVMERVFGLEQWKAQLITFVSDTCGAVNTRAFNKNLKELKVLGHMHDTIRKGLVHELLIAQDKVLCSYYAQRDGQQNQLKRQGATVRHLRTY